MKIVLYAVALIGMVTTTSCKKSISCIDTSKINTAINCGNVYDPVCGCDDITYPNSCTAQKYGVVQWIGGPCP